MYPPVTCLCTLVAGIMLSSGAVLAQSSQNGQSGHATPLAEVRFHAGKKIPCLSSAPEAGNPDTGPSTEVLKAAKDCVVPWHYHTAEEQLIVAAGTVLTEMERMPATTLEQGGFAVMDSKQKHQFTCKSTDPCILFVSFDRKYDIFWVEKKPTEANP